MANKMMTLKDVFKAAQGLPSRGALYLPRESSSSWTLDTPAAVLDFPAGGNDVNNLPFARKHGLRYVLHLSDVQDILANARQQRPNVDDGTILKAFLYYIEHDAFIVL